METGNRRIGFGRIPPDSTASAKGRGVAPNPQADLRVQEGADAAQQLTKSSHELLPMVMRTMTAGPPTGPLRVRPVAAH